MMYVLETDMLDRDVYGWKCMMYWCIVTGVELIRLIHVCGSNVPRKTVMYQKMIMCRVSQNIRAKETRSLWIM